MKIVYHFIDTLDERVVLPKVSLLFYSLVMLIKSLFESMHTVAYVIHKVSTAFNLGSVNYVTSYSIV